MGEEFAKGYPEWDGLNILCLVGYNPGEVL